MGNVEGSMVYQINNVLFFSLTNQKYDNYSDNGASFVQKRDLTQYQVSQLESPADQFETVKHPCRELVNYYFEQSLHFIDEYLF